MKINIRPLCINDLDDMVEMALETYNLEKQLYKILPNTPNMDYIQQQLKSIIKTGIGKMAVEDNRPIGFLTFEKPFSIGNDINGTISPLFGYGVRHEKRDIIINKLFQVIAAELCENYVQSYNINVYAHDTKILWMYIMTSFAMDVTEVIKDTNSPIETKKYNKFIYREVSKNELLNYKSDIIVLYRDLINHLRISPVFYHCKGFLPLENRVNDFFSDNLRLFAAFDEDILIGMINSEAVDIEMFTHDSNALCLGDIFVNHNYRKRGIASELLSFTNDKLKNDGINRLFVRHGTINPNARGFWDKYFTNYSYSMTRLIDSNMLGKIDYIG
jgi:GNAT superfamily N-acetyltransferase